ncbi:hypothetical protein FRC08_017134 [Ceratobasidium sp. 394]|nr:hypothetical protein FRC08_017134 [Ceratobasidium sp. 394]
MNTSTKPVEIPVDLDELAETLFPKPVVPTTYKAPKFRLLARLPPRRPLATVQRHTCSDSTQSGSSTSESSETKIEEVPMPKRKNAGDGVGIEYETVTVHRRTIKWTVKIVKDEEPNKRRKIEGEESESGSEDDSEDESGSEEMH